MSKKSYSYAPPPPLSPFHLALLTSTSSIPQAAASISSGHCNAFSSAGEVFAFLGDGSTEAERHACCEFAESIAVRRPVLFLPLSSPTNKRRLMQLVLAVQDGRDVTVFAEEETSAYFWHLLDDGLDYASAYVRHPPPPPAFSSSHPLLHSTGATAPRTPLLASPSSASTPLPLPLSPPSFPPSTSPPPTSPSSTATLPRTGSSFPLVQRGRRRS